MSEPLYEGPCQQQYFILVGRNTPDERLFHLNDLVSASAYSNENRLTIQSIQGRRLPADAVRALCPE